MRRVFRVRRRATDLEQDVDEEIAFHLEMRAAKLAASGLSANDAHAEARRQFGDLDAVRQSCVTLDRQREHTMNRVSMIDDLRHDLTHALRALRKQPCFTAIAAITLALGIGANSAMLSVLDHLLLHPLPFPEANRLVVAYRSNGQSMVMLAPQPVEVAEWRARARSVKQFEGMSGTQFMYETTAGSEQIDGARISPGFLTLLGARPMLGRGFTDADAKVGAPHVVLITNGFWRERFGGDRDVLGKTMRVDDQSCTIVGVLPPGFDVSALSIVGHARVFEPIEIAPDGSTRGIVIPIARLEPGATVAATQRELAAISSTVKLASFLSAWHVVVESPAEKRAAPLRTGLLVLLAAVGLVLLIACANVANLLIARSLTREREFAVRAAIGAGRGRLARQVLTESATLAALGGVLGVAVAWLGLRAVIAVRPPALEAIDGARIEPRVLAWTLGVTLLTGLLFGSVHALTPASRSLSDALRAGSRASQSRGARHFRAALVALEIVLSVMLLVGAGLLLRSVAIAQRTDIGFDPTHVASMGIAVGPASTRYSPEGRRRTEALAAQLEERVRQLPDVSGVARADGVPPSMSFLMTDLRLDSRTLDDATKPTQFHVLPATPDYFSVMRIALLEGRTFEPGDRASRGWLVSRSTARTFWPGESAIGHRFKLGTGDASWITVIGVVADVSPEGPLGNEAHDITMYAPADTNQVASTLVVRARGDPTTIVPTIRRELTALDRSATLVDVTSLSDAMASTLARPRFMMTLLGAFAGIAIVLAAVGLYGVISFMVSQRTREIGVRIALGAEPSRVRWLVVMQGLRLTLFGIAVGLVVAAIAARALRSMLFAVNPSDPLTFAGAALILGAVAIAATYVPARRATRIDAAIALRVD